MTVSPSSRTSAPKATSGPATTTTPRNGNTPSGCGSTASGTNTAAANSTPPGSSSWIRPFPAGRSEGPGAAHPTPVLRRSGRLTPECPAGIRLFEALQSPQLGEPGASTLESLIRAEASSCPGQRPAAPEIRSTQRHCSAGSCPLGARWSPPHSSKLSPLACNPKHGLQAKVLTAFAGTSHFNLQDTAYLGVRAAANADRRSHAAHQGRPGAPAPHQ
jgi:hypothetical protein